jgi:hypothetical protein
MPEAQAYRGLLDDLRSSGKERQNRAYTELIAATDVPVAWAYEAWDDLVRLLAEGDNRQRSIASQVLANLAKSDPEGRILRDLPALLRVTKDERFVTARHCLQALWKVGVAGEMQRRALAESLAARFEECAAEKNGTLIRYDILVVLRRVYDAVGEAPIRALAERLISSETDPKYRKKYAAVWR